MAMSVFGGKVTYATDGKKSMEPVLLIQSVTVCLLTGVLKPLVFSVIIESFV